MADNFFIETLGFESSEAQPSEKEARLVKKFQIDSVHFSGEYPAVFIKKVTSFNSKTLVELANIQRKVWNNSRVSFLYVTSPNEIRIYNCNESPVLLNRENSEEQLPNELNKRVIDRCDRTDLERLEVLRSIFSSVAIDSGAIWMSDHAKKVKLQTKVDHFLVSSLLNLAKRIRVDIDDDTIIHHLLMRCIFIMYLQDRKAIPDEIWEKFGSNDFLELLESVENTYGLFEEIQLHFNGNVFPVTTDEKSRVLPEHLVLIKHCLTDGDINLDQQKLFNWRIFDFSFIRIELLSEIYERFLGEFDPDRKKQTGTYYTPPSLVDLVLDEALPKGGTDFSLKVLDPACGSGIFLAQAYKRVVEFWKNANPGKDPAFDTLVDILKNSIYGVEIDNKSIKVASFSLYLALLDFLSPRDVWLKNGEKFPYLINDIDKKIDSGNNLYRCDTIEGGDFEKVQFDIIVGNPPFGTNGLADNIKAYCNKFGFNAQYVIPFIHKSSKLLSRNGKAVLLFNTKLLTNSNSKAENFRDWLFNENHVEKIYNLSILRKSPKDFGGHLFSSAVVPVSIVSFKKESEVDSDSIEYWAPKSFIKHHVVDGVIIDAADIKHLPREICQIPSSKIWKIAQWGTMADYHLIDRLLSTPPIKEYLNDEDHGVGFQTVDSTTTRPIINNEIGDIAFILPEHIERFYTSKDKSYSILKSLKTKSSRDHYYALPNSKKDTINIFRRLGKVKAYQAPHILIKEGLLDNKVCASYLEHDCSFNSKVYGIHSQRKDFLKTLTCVLNSKFGMYFMFLHSSSLGIEREEIKPTDVKRIPLIKEEFWGSFVELFDTIQSGRTVFNENEELIAEIDQLIVEALSLSDNDQILIEDFIEYTLPLFFNGARASSLYPISQDGNEMKLYSEAIRSELNNFLHTQSLYVNSTAYIPQVNSPLGLVVLEFSNSINEVEINRSSTELTELIDSINEYTLTHFSQSLYVRKQVRYYDDNKIIIVRPNQKRYWTKSQALDDSLTIINEIMSSSVQ